MPVLAQQRAEEHAEEQAPIFRMKNKEALHYYTNNGNQGVAGWAKLLQTGTISYSMLEQYTGGVFIVLHSVSYLCSRFDSALIESALKDYLASL